MTTAHQPLSLGNISTSRIEAFSDGVFAIATTLLVLEIKVPLVSKSGDLFGALFALWPSYVAYLVSFLTIGVMWINHHFLLGLYERVTRSLLFLNLGLLAVVSFIPFPTAVMAEYMVDGTTSQLFPAAALYGATMLLLSVMFLLLWMHTGRVPSALKNPDATAKTVSRAVRFCLMAIGAYVIAVAAAAIAPILALILFAVVAVLFAVGRLD